MTRKTIAPVAGIAVIGLIVAVRHCLQTMAMRGEKGAPVKVCGQHRRDRCHAAEASEPATKTAAGAA